MLNFLKSKEQKQTDLIYEIMNAWHAGCVASVDSKELLKEPRVIAGTILFFIGSIDNLCQSANLDDKKFGELALGILENIGYPGEIPGLIFLNFYNPTKKQSAFALSANTEGGRCVGQFIANRNPMICSIFSTLVSEWAKNPEMTGEDLYLFSMESKEGDTNEEKERANVFDEDFEDITEEQKKLMEKYKAINFEEYSFGYTDNIQKAIKSNSTFLFQGSVDEIFSKKGKKYIRISSSLYSETSGIIEISNEWEKFFAKSGDNELLFLDSFNFIIKIAKAEELILKPEKDSEYTDASSQLLLHGKLIYAEMDSL